jgi:hypothetical protein
MIVTGGYPRVWRRVAQQQGMHGRPATPGRAIALAMASILLALGLNVAYTTWSVESSRSAQQHQGELVERKICTTMAHLAALKPPAGNPVTNPSRAFDQNLHSALDGLGFDLGCR